MAKLVSKLYRPADLVDVINKLETIMSYWIKPHYDGSGIRQECKDLVIDLRKMGYKIVKVDDEKAV